MADNEKVYLVKVEYTIRVRGVNVTENNMKTRIETRIFEGLQKLRDNDQIDVDMVGSAVIEPQP